MRIENRLQLQLWREECKEKHQKEKCRILVCGGTGCLAGGSDKIYARFKEMSEGMDHVTVKIGEEIAHPGVKMSGCHGFCEMGPLVRIEPYNYLYLKVKLEDCEEIFEKTILRGEPVERLMYHDDHKVYETQEEIPFYAKQTRLVLKNCGHIDAEHIGGSRIYSGFGDTDLPYGKSNQRSFGQPDPQNGLDCHGPTRVSRPCARMVQQLCCKHLQGSSSRQ